MDQPMMRPAQQNQVGQRGGSSVGPVLDVVNITPPMRAVAARESATAVPDHHGPAQGSRYHGSAAPHLQRLRPSDGDDPGDGGVTGPPPGGPGGEGACIAQLAGEAGTSFQRLQVHRDGDVGALTGYLRTVPG
jgi:hypothetical protein